MDGALLVAVSLECIGCGCTSGNACVTENGACFWVSDDPPICSACSYGTADHVDE